jgi:hypothetical protein
LVPPGGAGRFTSYCLVLVYAPNSVIPAALFLSGKPSDLDRFTANNQSKSILNNEGGVQVALKKSDLYSSLWKSCDELRGGMDASQYKDYILTLLFVKYVSDKARLRSKA